MFNRYVFCITGLILGLAVVLLAACRPKVQVTPTARPVVTKPGFTATPVPTPRPKALTVCLGQEPDTLYPLGNPNAAGRSVLSAIYDGPIDSVAYKYQPVIMKKIPNIVDGDAFLEPITVGVGDKVVDADGNLVTLSTTTKTRVYPSGCRSADCIVEYAGMSELIMDQMGATFKLLPDLVWSDGTSLTADDSVYAFDLASDDDTPGSKYLIDRTESYEVIDDQTVTWTGMPGYLDPTYFTNFWAPAPQQQWGDFDAKELLSADVATRSPIGWGAYVIKEWIPGESIVLTKNPLYFRAEEGLPKLDTVTFRFIEDPNAAVSALLDGECDVLDPSIRLDGEVGLLLQLKVSKQIQALFTPSTLIERLDLGIRPATYDDGYTPGFGSDRPDIFGDKRTRQAIAMCLDRQKVVDTVLFGQSVVPDTYLPPDHPLHNPDIKAYEFDVTAAKRLLDEVGWKDHDSDPSTPRQAQGVENIRANAPLLLDYVTTSAVQRRQVVEILSQSLAECGIGLNIKFMSQDELYAAGPAGPLFGRKFDLAQFAMGTNGLEMPCTWFTTSQMPNEKNKWIGTNVSGYRNTDFDKACLVINHSLPGEAEYSEAYNRTQAIFADDLPSIPLYLRIKVAASRPDLCNFSVDPTTTSDLWNIEVFDINASCIP